MIADNPFTTVSLSRDYRDIYAGEIFLDVCRAARVPVAVVARGPKIEQASFQSERVSRVLQRLEELAGMTVIITAHYELDKPETITFLASFGYTLDGGTDEERKIIAEYGREVKPNPPADDVVIQVEPVPAKPRGTRKKVSK